MKNSGPYEALRVGILDQWQDTKGRSPHLYHILHSRLDVLVRRSGGELDEHGVDTRRLVNGFKVVFDFAQCSTSFTRNS